VATVRAVLRCGIGAGADPAAADYRLRSAGVDSLLAFATELERRDADVAVRLAAVERRQQQVEEVRRLLADADARLQRLPQLRAAQERDEASALDARAQSVTAVREAEDELAGARESARATAERRLDDARAALRAVERELEHLDERRAGLQETEAEAERQRAQAAAQARALGAGDAVADWASQERGALLVEHSNLVRERDAIVREASELLASVLGDAAVLTSVGGLRARLERVLATGA
jgi:colicin import membrane protein